MKRTKKGRDETIEVSIISDPLGIRLNGSKMEAKYRVQYHGEDGSLDFGEEWLDHGTVTTFIRLVVNNDDDDE